MFSVFIGNEDYNKCTSSTVVNNGVARELEKGVPKVSHPWR